MLSPPKAEQSSERSDPSSAAGGLRTMRGREVIRAGVQARISQELLAEF